MASQQHHRATECPVPGGVLVARNKRIGMLNESIGDVCPSHSVSSCNRWLTCGVQVKFMFFAWEED